MPEEPQEVRPNVEGERRGPPRQSQPNGSTPHGIRQPPPTRTQAATVAERSADGTAGHQSRTYLARFQTNSSVTPAAVLGLVNFSSSAVSEVIIRF